ncbi:hypothetical protein ACISK3_11830 [Morganella morganii]|nr:hypothetical protein [Morganella morganii]
MKELNYAEIELVSGSGCIQDTISGFGEKLGDLGFGMLSPFLKVDLPVIGKVSLKDFVPNLGKNVGGKVGAVVGGLFEKALGRVVDLDGICK